jgi:hypothetical protein
MNLLGPTTAYAAMTSCVLDIGLKTPTHTQANARALFGGVLFCTVVSRPLSADGGSFASPTMCVTDTRDVATARLIENWIDESERRVWF